MTHNSLLIAHLYENSSVGRASAQWGGRPRPPTDMAARDGPPTNTVVNSTALSRHPGSS
jgi:hypothetical protein